MKPWHSTLGFKRQSPSPRALCPGLLQPLQDSGVTPRLPGSLEDAAEPRATVRRTRGQPHVGSGGEARRGAAAGGRGHMGVRGLASLPFPASLRGGGHAQNGLARSAVSHPCLMDGVG